MRVVRDSQRGAGDGAQRRAAGGRVPGRARSVRPLLLFSILFIFFLFIFLVFIIFFFFLFFLGGSDKGERGHAAVD